MNIDPHLLPRLQRLFSSKNSFTSYNIYRQIYLADLSDKLVAASRYLNEILGDSYRQNVQKSFDFISNLIQEKNHHHYLLSFLNICIFNIVQ